MRIERRLNVRGAAAGVARMTKRLSPSRRSRISPLAVSTTK